MSLKKQYSVNCFFNVSTVTVIKTCRKLTKIEEISGKILGFKMQNNPETDISHGQAVKLSSFTYHYFSSASNHNLTLL